MGTEAGKSHSAAGVLRLSGSQALERVGGRVHETGLASAFLKCANLKYALTRSEDSGDFQRLLPQDGGDNALL
jgi:hypothetical protein